MTETEIKKTYLTKKISLVKLVSENDDELGDKFLISEEIAKLQNQIERLRNQFQKEFGEIEEIDNVLTVLTETNHMLKRETSLLDSSIKQIKDRDDNVVLTNTASKPKEEPKPRVEFIQYIDNVLRFYILEMFKNKLNEVDVKEDKAEINHFSFMLVHSYMTEMFKNKLETTYDEDKNKINSFINVLMRYYMTELFQKKKEIFLMKSM